jgi:glycosyltransferase involved in cell wall biosynthesis
MGPADAKLPMRLGVDGRVLDDRYHGIGRITFELLQRLSLFPGWEITLFLSHDQQSDRFDIADLLSRPSVRIRYFDESLTSVTQFLRWPRVLKRSGVDAILFPYHLGASLFSRSRRFAIVHDCIFEANPRFAPDTRTRTLYILLTKCVVRRNRIITPSKASAMAVQQFHHVTVPASQVVEWGVAQAFGFGFGKRKVQQVDGVDLPDRYYLHVGARRPHKNVEQLVRVLAELQPDEYLVLVGSADRRWPDHTTELAGELGVADRIIELNGVSEDDLAALYRQATAFLYPSLVEGFGLPLLEAMVAGTPVVASDIPVFREVADGAALLVPPDDTGAWVRAIRELDASMAREVLIKGGRRRAALATWDSAATNLASVLTV